MSAYTRTQRLLVLPLLVLLLAAALVAASVVTAGEAQAASQKQIRKATAVAKNQIGDPYSYGAEGPNAFDCSGLTYFAYKKVGISLPRSPDAQYRFVRGIRKENIRKGDLMFLHGSSGVYHVGIFVGWDSGRRVILHSPNSGSTVHRQRMWTGSWWAGTLRPKG